MNQSPNSLKDTIRIMNSNLDAIGIIEFNGKHYVNESNIRSYMKECDVEDIDIVISNINEFYNIKDVSIISEANDDLDLQFINEVMSLLEIDAKEVIKTADGVNALTMYVDQAAALILKHKYDKSTELKRYIARCDRVLDDIAEEKKVAKKKGQNDSYKFTAYYIYDLAKNIFTLFLAPLVMTKATIKWPAAVLKLFDGVKGKLFKSIVKGSTSPSVLKTVASAGFKTGEVFIGGMPSDLKNLYLSVNDYEKLLNHYEYKIKTVKAGLEYQLKQLELKDQEERKKKMLELKEEVKLSNDNVEVQYKSPAEIEGKPEIKFDKPAETTDKVVLHDEKDNECGNKEVEIAKPAVPVAQTPSEPEKKDLTPIEAINRARGQASNVLVTKLGDKYYIDLKDLKDYMNRNKSDNYDLAVDDIIQANNDDPDFNRSSIKVLMSNGDLENCSSQDKEKLESASVEFEIYPDKQNTEE